MRRAALLALLLFALVAPVAAQTPTPTIYTCNLPPPPTATPEPTYSDILLSLSPIAYWKLDETSGSTAFDSSGNGFDGTYSGVTLAAATGPDGAPAPSFDGVNDYVNVYSAGLASAFNPAEGTIVAWARVASSAIWTDGAVRRVINLETNTNNRLHITRTTANGQMQFFYRTNTSFTQSVSLAGLSPVTYMHYGQTWSSSANEFKAYYGGSQTGSTQSGLSTWAGSLSSTATNIGIQFTSGTSPWHGSIAHVALFDYALSPAQIATLATVPIPSTPTPEPECIPVRDVDQWWTVEVPPVAGTPQPGQPVRFSYAMSAGQAAQAVMTATLIFSLWVIFLIWALMVRRRKSEGRKD